MRIEICSMLGMTPAVARNLEAVRIPTDIPIISTSISDRLSQWSLMLLMAFPLVDFTLRLSPIHPIGVIWDKVVLVILLFVAVRRWLAGHRPRWFEWQRVGILYVLFVICLMFAGFSHPLVAFDGFRADVYYMSYAFLIPFLVAPRDIFRLLHVAACVAILIGVHGVYQYVTKAPIPHSWVDVGEHVRSRVYSVLTSPNELGAYMALLTPIIVGLFAYEQNKVRKALYGIGVIPCFATLLFTFDRGSWISLALAVAVTAILYQRKLLLVLIGFLVIAFFVPSIHHRLMDLLSPVYYEKASQAGRIEKWSTAIQQLRRNPLFGAGVGKYGGMVASDFHFGTYSDGYYFKVLGESGIMGLILFVGMQVALLIEIAKKVVKPTSGRARFLAIGAFTGLLAVVFHNIVENVFEFAPMAAMYFNISSLFLMWARTRVDEATNVLPRAGISAKADASSTLHVASAKL